eukprot:jgi/Botrbrau1/17624/Bobra.0166s0058.1
MEPRSMGSWLTLAVCLLCILPFSLSSERRLGTTGGSKSAAPSPSQEFPFDATHAEGSLEALAPSAGGMGWDLNAAIATAHNFGMPRLAAYLSRLMPQSSPKTVEQAAEHPKPAPEPMDVIKKLAASAPGPAESGSAAEEPSFKGKPLARTEADERQYAKMKAEEAAAKAEGRAAPVPFPIIYLDQLYNINDLQADEIFSKGTAEIPSDIAKHNFAFCNQDVTLTQAWEKPTNWPRVDWPEADEIFNDISRAFWHGKWFVTDPETHERKLFNIIFLDDTLGFIANTEYANPGFHPDGKPSFLVNYSSTEATIFKAVLDEFRRVGPTIFLGSGIAYIDVYKYLARYPQPWTQALLTAFRPLIDFGNAAFTGTTIAVRALRNMSEYTNLRYPPEQFLPFSFYFAVDCQDYRIPPMHWIPIWTDGLTAFQNFWGWNPPGYQLPSVPGTYSDPEWGKSDTTKFAAPPFRPASNSSAFPPDPNDPSLGLRFNTSAGKVDPFVLLPYTMPANATAGTSDMQGFLQLPAKMVQPLFKNFWSASSAQAPVTKDEYVAPAFSRQTGEQ